MLQPQQRKAEDGDKNVRIEDHAGITRRKIVGVYDLINMPAGSTKQKRSGADHCREAKIKAATGSKKTHDSKAEAGKTNFRLKRAVVPADHARGHRAKKRVHHKIVQIAEPD